TMMMDWAPRRWLARSTAGFNFCLAARAARPAAAGTGSSWNPTGTSLSAAGAPTTEPPRPKSTRAYRKMRPRGPAPNPPARAANLSAFPVQALGFANVNAFKVRYINVPQFGDEDCTGTSVSPGNASNTFAVTLYDDGTGIDENASQPLNPANPIGNNAVPF